jgi:hypothetical protein
MIPRRLAHEVQEGLMLGSRPLRAKPRGHRLDRLAFPRQQEPKTVTPERFDPVLVPETLRKALDIGRKPRFTPVIVPLEIHRCPRDPA